MNKGFTSTSEVLPIICRDVGGIVRSHGYRFLNAAKAAEEIKKLDAKSEICLPEEERPFRELLKFDTPKTQLAICRKAKDIVGDGKVTTRAINEAAVMLGHIEKPAAGKKVRSPEEKTIGSIKSALRRVIQSLSENGDRKSRFWN